MSGEIATQSIRSLVTETFAMLGVNRPEPQERILIRDGNYCGRRFEVDGLAAVWFVDEGQIKFYGAVGAVIKVIDCQAGAASHYRRAA